MNKFLGIIALASFLFFAPSCKSRKATAKTDRKELEIKHKSPHTLAQLLKDNEFTFTHFNAKASVDAEIDSNNISFKANLKMIKDSVIWISLSKAAIQGARVLISKDSVKFINYINKTYFSGDFGYINSLLNADLDFEMVQSLLVGNSVAFYEEDEKLKSSFDHRENQYLLGTKRKRKVKKVVEKNKELREPLQSIWLNPDTFKIVRILFYEFDTDRNFNASFSDFKLTGPKLLPYKINYSVKAEKQLKVMVEYQKTDLETPEKLPFIIPENYEPVRFNKK